MTVLDCYKLHSRETVRVKLISPTTRYRGKGTFIWKEKNISVNVTQRVPYGALKLTYKTHVYVEQWSVGNPDPRVARIILGQLQPNISY